MGTYKLSLSKKCRLIEDSQLYKHIHVSDSVYDQKYHFNRQNVVDIMCSFKVISTNEVN